MSAAPPLPLAGLKVVELCQNVAGPYAGLVLSQLGAEVAKVERPGAGDDTRQWRPPAWEGESTMFMSMNAGKRSVALDLREEGDRDRLWELIDEADVLLQSWRPGSLARAGFGADAVTARCPSLIYCSVTAFGDEGPLAAEPGYDPLIQAFCGLMAVTGEPGGNPVRVGTSIIDMGTGMWAAIAVLSALSRRAADGSGAVIDTSLLETGLGWVPYQIASFLASGAEPAPMGSGMPMLVPYQAFRTARGAIVIAAGNDALWRKLCQAIERPDLGSDPELATNPQRIAARDRVVAELERTLATRTAAEWQVVLREAGVPTSVVHSVGEAIDHPQSRATGMLGPVEHDRIADLRLLGLPFKLDGRRPRPQGPAPDLDAG